MKKRTASRIAALAALGTGALLTAAAITTKTRKQSPIDSLAEHSDNPALDYDMAIARYAAMQAEDDDTINPVCRSKIMTHGAKTERVIVLVHGITNCPEQFAEFAPLFFEQGYNVLIPRMPRNGLADRMTDELKRLTAEELRDSSNTLVDIACGLGDHITFLGLSVGAVMAAWVAQHRPEINKAVIIAPSIGFTNLGADRFSSFAIRLFRILPNIGTQHFSPFSDGPKHSYLGFSSRSFGVVMVLGKSILKSAKQEKPAAQSILMVTNAADTAVNSKINRELVNFWRANGYEQLEEYEFSADKKLIHDIIDPQQVQQQTALVYPILLDLITR
jgi:pimeloyl-ACP methyl ester carboxylesterase